MAVSQIPCNESEVDDVTLIFEDWACSLLPQFFKSGIPLCPVRASMYHSLRGNLMCHRKGCTKAGTQGVDNLFYCPDHIAQATVPAQVATKVKFTEGKEVAQRADLKAGVSLVPDIVLVPLIEQLRKGGFSKQSDLIGELTERYGGNEFDNALHVRNLESESERLAQEFEERLNRIEITVEKPRIPPSPHTPSMPTTEVPKQVEAAPDAVVVPTVVRPVVEVAPAVVVAGFNVPDPVAAFSPVVVSGRLVSTPTDRVNAGLLTEPPVSSLFSTAPPAAPIPGVSPPLGGALSETALLTSMVYHMDRIANPDVNPKPGTLDGIRRNDEIHVYVARGFDNFTVTLCPGVVGKQLALGLKALNERLRPLYDLHQLPTGFSNRFCIGAACLTWGDVPKRMTG